MKWQWLFVVMSVWLRWHLSHPIPSLNMNDFAGRGMLCFTYAPVPQSPQCSLNYTFCETGSVSVWVWMSWESCVSQCVLFYKASHSVASKPCCQITLEREAGLQVVASCRQHCDIYFSLPVPIKFPRLNLVCLLFLWHPMLAFHCRDFWGAFWTWEWAANRWN